LRPVSDHHAVMLRSQPVGHSDEWAEAPERPWDPSVLDGSREVRALASSMEQLERTVVQLWEAKRLAGCRFLDRLDAASADSGGG
jgi:hypothetical protein